MRVRLMLAVMLLIAGIVTVVPSGIAFGSGAPPTAVPTALPRLTASFVNDTAKRTSRVVVQYSVADGPQRYRTVLQCQESTDGPFERVDASLAQAGTLIDVEPGDRKGKYRVVMEGARGFVLAYVDLGRVG